MSSDAYVHEPLQDTGRRCIRLLLFQFGSGEQTVRCDVSHWALDEAPPFLAISYTWGLAEDAQRMIYLDGKEMAVRKNCHQALCQVRHNFPTLHIWVDAICINQSDKVEKSFQVSIMGQVYERSVKVLACIGPHDEASSRVEPFLKALADDMPHLLPASDGSRSRFAQFAGLERAHFIEGMSWRKQRLRDTGDDLLALFKQYHVFTQRPYWSRLWILQEVHAGLTIDSLAVVCGPSVWAWAELRTFNEILGRLTFATFYDQDPELPGLEMTLGIGSYATMLGLTPKRRSIHEAISWFPYFGCSDPRDKIYGLLNTIHWQDNRLRMEPDYTKDLFDVILDVLDHFAGDGIMWWWTDLQTLCEGLRIDVQHSRVQDLLRAPQAKIASSAQRIHLCVAGTKARVLTRRDDGRLYASLAEKQSRPNEHTVLAHIPEVEPTKGLPSLEELTKDYGLRTVSTIFHSASP